MARTLLTPVSGFQDKGGQVFNVKAYGALGDNSTDDTASIQAAIDAAEAVGGSVYTPQGVYIINGTVNIPSSIRFYGAGMDNGNTVVGTTFKRTTSTGEPMFSVMGGVPESGDAVSTAPVKRVSMSDFTLRAASSSDTLLRMFYTNRNHLARVRFIGTTGHAIHGVEFWDTTLDSCTFDFTGDSDSASVILQNRASATAGEAGYSNDNCNRLTFRGCTWESFTSKCIEMEGATNGSTHLMNNITIDDCKFETSTFRNPFIQTGANVASVYIKDSYFASNALDSGATAVAQILLGGSSASVRDCRFYQGQANVIETSVRLDGHAGQNTVDSITCNYLGSAPTSTAAVVIGTPVTPSEDSVTNVKSNTGIKVVDGTGYSSFRAVEAITATADQEPNFVWKQTGTNPKEIKLGVTASGNFSMIPDNGALWTVKKPDNTNFAVFDMVNGRMAGGMNSTNVAPTAGLFAAGSFGQAITNRSANFTFLETDGIILADATSGNITATLPNATTCKGRIHEVKKIDSSSNTITIATTSSQTIEGASTKVISERYSGYKLQSDGSNWILLNNVSSEGGSSEDVPYVGDSAPSSPEDGMLWYDTDDNTSLANTVLADNVDSESATDGYVLTADGAGGAAWEAVSGGGSGDVTAASNFSSDNAIVRSDGTVKGVQGSLAIVNDDGGIFTPASIETESGIITDSIDEVTLGEGVTIDGVLLKDGGLDGVPFATTTDAQTLTNKTLTSPTLTGTPVLPATVTANTYSVTFPGASTTIVGRSTPDTLTNKRTQPRVSSTASASSLTPNVSSYDQYCYTALAANLTINSPSGSPANGEKLMFRIKDNGTSRTLTWNSIFRPIGVTLPASTTASKILYIGCIYNAADTKWDTVAVSAET